MLNLMDASREEVAEADRRHRAGIADALARFAVRWGDAGRDALDGSVESLLTVGEFFLSEIRSPAVQAPPTWLLAWSCHTARSALDDLQGVAQREDRLAADAFA